MKDLTIGDLEVILTSLTYSKYDLENKPYDPLLNHETAYKLRREIMCFFRYSFSSLLQAYT